MFCFVDGFRTSKLLLIGLATLLAADASAANPAATCASSKRKATGKDASSKLKCVSKAAGKGLAVDTACLDKAELKLILAFSKAESKGGCLAIGDAAAVDGVVDTCVGNLRTQLGVPGTPTLSRCTAAKLNGAASKLSSKATCHAKAALKLLPVDAICLAKAETKFVTAFTKAELKGDCLTLSDAAAVEATVDVCIGNFLTALPAPTTTTTTTTTSTTTTTAPASCGSEPPAFAGVTAQHNATRAGALPVPVPALPAMCWSGGPAAAAQAWADGCNWSHDPTLGALNQGQNIYATAQSVGFSPTAAQEAEPAWASEIADYNYSTNTCSAVCGHYTQIVWRSTVYLGCGLKQCTVNSPFGPGYPNWTFVVCNYAPPGNYVGQWPY